MSGIDDKKITVELSLEEALILMGAVIGHMRHLNRMPPSLVGAAMGVLANLGGKIQSAIAAREKKGE